jgi:diaminopimelate decarboxylase
MKTYFTEQTDFYRNTSPDRLAKEYGSPLYVYSEHILRERCKEMASLISYPNLKSNFSIKANSNIEILKIAHEEGLNADAMSPGEIYVLLKAGFKPEEILYISNKVSEEEMKYAIDRGITVSVDSLSQLSMLGRLKPGGKVAVRLNPGIGAGHHEKVITAGKKTKFGVNLDYVPEVKRLLKEHNLKLAGVNQHIGSLFTESTSYIEGVKSLLSIAEQFDDLEFVDLGGGFGIPYHKQDGQARLDLKGLDSLLTGLLDEWTDKYGKKLRVKIEPGRYVAAECGVLLGTVYALKRNYGNIYVGTDLGFNVLARPVLYDSYHDVEVYRDGKLFKTHNHEVVTTVGNICESGDIIAKERNLSGIQEGDILGIMDAGAYGYAMSSNYNNRLRPAEVLIKADGNPVLIRRRDTLEDLMRNFVV